jgi:hypothetical protein
MLEVVLIAGVQSKKPPLLGAPMGYGGEFDKPL